MHSFYIDKKGAAGECAGLPKEEAKHALKVLRLGVGDEVSAMDGMGGRFAAVIDSINGDNVILRLAEELPDNEAPVQITLYQGLPKSDKLDFIVQKITELGAVRLAPVKMERCVVKLDAKDAAKRRERLEKIAHEATKQCKRASMPEILEAMTWKQALQDMKALDLVIVPWEEASGTRMKDVFTDRPDAKRIGIVIGPEGGMSEGEIEAMCGAGVVPVTLGPRILRAETAAVVSVGMAMTLWGDL
ncbi:MAG: 16S rRNA (uracil(1498)-N(3))-methyltransferase [Clostridia bacterium]|nr:16S rRNA (uracil(1498)-N(3))-methyltransferase [Clostridia bacterium]